jgi:protein arginine kinase activator
VKCQVCGEADATIHFKELKNEVMRELHLCPACAEEKGFHSVLEQDKLSLTNQFLWMAENLYPEGSGKAGQLQCNRCGLRYSEFTRMGRLGCPECYRAFDDPLKRLLRRIHGTTRHAGKVPGRGQPSQSRRAKLHHLQEELQKAIAAENYELAADLRDRIRLHERNQTTEEPRK